MDIDENKLKPWSIIEFWQYYNDPRVFKYLAIASFSPPVFFGLLSLLTLIKNEKLHGDAKFATKQDIRKKGLLQGIGIILGKIGNNFLVADGTEHVLVSAPTRSGKGVGIVIPNLLNWDDSAVVLDIKLENYKATSGFRKKHGHTVFLWSPSDKNGVTHCYNPLDIIDKHNKHLRIDDIQKIATFLCPAPLDGDPMWANEGRNLFIAIVLYLIDLDMPVTLGECNRFIKSYTTEELEELVEYHTDTLDSLCIANFTNFIGMGDKQASGVKSTLTSSLSLFDNPIIDAMTSTSDFVFSDLRKKKTTIYVGVTPDKLGTLAPLLNLFFQQCCDVLISSLPDKKTEPHKVLMLLDEFTSLGRMDVIKDGIAFFAGYHLRLMPIIQTPQQLFDKYGETGAKSMIGNFMYQIVFAPNNIEDATDVSNRMGTKTVKTKSHSASGGFSNTSTSTSETSRALMLPQEIMLMNRKDSIILIEAMRPIQAKKVIYFSDNHFKGRFFNVFDPTKNDGELPVQVPKQKIIAKDFIKEVINYNETETSNDDFDTGNQDEDELKNKSIGDLYSESEFNETKGYDSLVNNPIESESESKDESFNILNDFLDNSATSNSTFTTENKSVKKLSKDQIDALVGDLWKSTK